MKRSIKLLAFLLCLAMTLIPMLSLSASATGEANDTPAETRGRLAITEINAADANNTAYQYIEVINVSDVSVDLSEYYLYRWAISDNSGLSDNYIIDRLIGIESWSNVLSYKTPLTSTSVTLESGEVALLWLNNKNAPDYKNDGDSKNSWVTGASQDDDSDIDENDFRLKWSVPNTTKVVSVVQGHDARLAYYINTQVGEKNNGGFLPLYKASCIVELMHEDATFGGLTPATDAIWQGAEWGGNEATFKGAGAIERHQAADSVAVYFTKQTIQANNVYHYYGYINQTEFQKYTGYGAGVIEGTQDNQLDSVTISNYVNFVTGKTNADGSYTDANGNMSGVRVYTNPSVTNAGNVTDATYFADNGTAGIASAGKLANGQFGYNAMRMVGSQSKVDTNNYAVRFVASFEADALANQGVGFDIVATYAGGEKTFTKVCGAVYSKLGGGVTDGTYNGDINANYMTYLNDEYNRGDEYFVALSVNNIAITTYDEITFEVTPYVIDAFGNKISGESATFVYNDGELQ